MEDRSAGKREEEQTEASGSESLWLGEDDHSISDCRFQIVDLKDITRGKIVPSGLGRGKPYGGVLRKFRTTSRNLGIWFLQISNVTS
jgi:hypothetical protein